MSDFGDGKWVIARKEHRCEGCYAKIPKGERHLSYRGVVDGGWQSWRMHNECYMGYEKSAMEDGQWEFISGDWPVPERIAVLLKREVV